MGSEVRSSDEVMYIKVSELSVIEPVGDLLRKLPICAKPEDDVNFGEGRIEEVANLIVAKKRL